MSEFSKNYPENGSISDCEKAQKALYTQINQTRLLESLFLMENWQIFISTIRLMQEKHTFPEVHSIDLLQSFIVITPRGIFHL